MKNSSPYAQDKLVHEACAEGLGNLRHHHSATLDREDILFSLYFVCFILSFFYFIYILFQGLSLKHSFNGLV